MATVKLMLLPGMHQLLVNILWWFTCNMLESSNMCQLVTNSAEAQFKNKPLIPLQNAINVKSGQLLANFFC